MNKAARARQRLLETAKTMAAGTYCRKVVAPLFQRMIRAEAGALPEGYYPAIRRNVIAPIYKCVGECVCVTCGDVNAWDSGIKGMHTGHFVASRRNSILLEEDNVAPQCSSCNFYQSGAPTEFRMWMIEIRGIEVIERLQALKRESVSFSRDELVDLRIAFRDRLKAAEAKMKGI